MFLFSDDIVLITEIEHKLTEILKNTVRTLSSGYNMKINKNKTIVLVVDMALCGNYNSGEKTRRG